MTMSDWRYAASTIVTVPPSVKRVSCGRPVRPKIGIHHAAEAARHVEQRAANRGGQRAGRLALAGPLHRPASLDRAAVHRAVDRLERDLIAG